MTIIAKIYTIEAVGAPGFAAFAAEAGEVAKYYHLGGIKEEIHRIETGGTTTVVFAETPVIER